MTFRRIAITSHDQWMAERAKCVATASTVGALLAPHPFETSYSVWARAVGILGPTESNDAMDAGTDAEHMMPARAKRLRPNLSLVKCNSFYIDDELRFGATPDFFDARRPNCCWQAKCTDPSIFTRDWANGPPLWVELQLQAEMLATGCTEGGILCLVRDRTFSTYLYDYEAHEGAQQHILHALAEMRRRVDEEDPPSKDYVADSDAILAGIPRPVSEKIIDLTEDNRARELIVNYRSLGEEIKARELQQAGIKSELMEKVGDAEAATCGEYRIGAKMIKESQISYTRKSYRDFRVTGG